MSDYDEFYEWSRTNRAGFWGYTAERLGIRFIEPAKAVLEGTPEHPVWFAGAQLNIAESCFNADPGKTAIRYRRDEALHNITYGELRRMANRVANGLVAAGLGADSRVAIAMPMNVEAVIAYLGIILSGGVVVSIADSFAPDEIATRMRIAGADTAFTQDVIRRSGKSLPMFEKVAAAGVARAIVVDTGADITLRSADLTWTEFLGDDDEFAPVPRQPNDHGNILFSSGTTGDPKAIPWTQLSSLKAAADGHYHHDVHAEDVVAWPTNLGWMMGPWLLYTSFLNRATMALYDDAPTGAGFGKFVEEAGVSVLGVVPSLVAAWRTSGVMDGVDWSRIRVFGSTGEASNAEDMAFLMDLAGSKPIIDYIGGTEISGGYMACTVLHSCIPATFTTPTLGGGVQILDEDGHPAIRGELFIEAPVVGMSTELLNRDHHDIYYAGVPASDRVLRRHGDEVELLENGHYRALGRVDDTMNLGGIKVSSAEIERAVAGTPGVKESAAIAVEPAGGGPSRLVICVVVDGEARAADLSDEMQRRIRAQLNPLFKVSDVVVVETLPRTASAKVMRRSLRTDYLNR